MLHEVLMAVVGYPGDIITDDFCVRPALVPDVISVADSAIIDAITRHGFHYSLLLSAVDSTCCSRSAFSSSAAAQHTSATTLRPHGLMVQALMLGVDQPLCAFRDLVCEVEERAIEDPALPLTRVRFLLREFEITLPAAWSLVNHIITQNYSGGQLVNEIRRRLSIAAAPRVRALLHQLLRHCNVVMFNLVEEWMLEGKLRDTHQEFFIQERLSRVVAGGASKAIIAAEYEWLSQFSLRTEMVPKSYISVEIANKILFAGKATRVLHQHMQGNANSPSAFGSTKSKSTSAAAATTRPQSTRSSTPTAPTITANNASQSDVVLDDRSSSPIQLNGEQAAEAATYTHTVLASVPAADRANNHEPQEGSCNGYDDFHIMFDCLRASAELDESLLEHTVEHVYRRVAKDLWTLVVEDARLVDHLTFLRDFYFLGRGEFFSFFLQNGKRLFSMPPARSLVQAQQAVRSGPWHEASVQCGFDMLTLSSPALSMSSLGGGNGYMGTGQTYNTGSGGGVSNMPITAAQFDQLRVRLSRPNFSFVHGFHVEAQARGGGDNNYNNNKSSSSTTTSFSGGGTSRGAYPTSNNDDAARETTRSKYKPDLAVADCVLVGDACVFCSEVGEDSTIGATHHRDDDNVSEAPSDMITVIENESVLSKSTTATGTSVAMARRRRRRRDAASQGGKQTHHHVDLVYGLTTATQSVARNPNLVAGGRQSVHGNQHVNSGGLWYGEKLPVEQGFVSTAVLHVNDSVSPTATQDSGGNGSIQNSSNSSSSFALVIHNCARLGPTALGVATSSKPPTHRNAASSRALPPSACFRGIPNSVAVCAQWDNLNGATSPGLNDATYTNTNPYEANVAPTLTLGVYSLGPRENDTSPRATRARVSIPWDNITHESNSHTDQNPAFNPSSFSQSAASRVVRLTVRYDLEGGEEKNSPTFMVLRVLINDQQVLFCEFDVGRTLCLERGTGRAWIGLLADAPEGSSIRVSGWKTDAHQPGYDSFDFDPWRHIMSLDVALPWPLCLVVSQQVLSSYNAIFQFLLAVKRVGDSLKDSWGLLVQKRFKTSAFRSGKHAQRLMHLCRLRASMAFIVDNLQFHLQVDVIDSLFSHLRSSISQAKDFQSVVHAHDEFVDDVITQTKLHNRAIRNGFDKILRLCLRFGQLATRFASLDHDEREGSTVAAAENDIGRANSVNRDGRASDIGEGGGRRAGGVGEVAHAMAELDQSIATLASTFTTDVRMLFSLLRREKSSLLARLDFNGHFTALARGQSFYESSIAVVATSEGGGGTARTSRVLDL